MASLNRRARAEAVKAATSADWRSGGGKRLTKARGDRRLVVTQQPELILDAKGEVIGVDVWVELFDEQGNELPIDPHRRIINPPTVPRSGIPESPGLDRSNPVRLIGEPQQRTTARTVTADPLEAFYEAVWDSIEETPNPQGWRTRGTVTTIYPDASDGFLQCIDVDYTTAANGSLLFGVNDDSASLYVGQIYDADFSDYAIHEAFLSFDTSAIADTDVVSAVDLSVWLVSDASDMDFVIEAREKDWGATVEVALWTPPASLPSYPLLASLDTSGMGATGAYKTLTSESAFFAATNLRTGVVYVMLNGSRHRAMIPPSLGVWDLVILSSSDQDGTTQDPKLTITHADVSGGSAATVTASAAGGGSLAVSGGSQATVSVSSSGAGSPAFAGGAEADVTAVVSSSGSPGPAGGAATSVDAMASGAGSPATSSGADATVTASTAGAGSPATSSGADSTVTATSSGAGSLAMSGGGEAAASVTASGAGTPATSGGSVTASTITAFGAGQLGASGGADASVTISSTGGGARLFVDLTVTVGPTRTLDRVAVGESRQSVAVGESRLSWTVAASRPAEHVEVGTSQVRERVTVGESRTSTTVGPTRAGTSVGPSRTQRGE